MSNHSVNRGFSGAIFSTVPDFNNENKSNNANTQNSGPCQRLSAQTPSGTPKERPKKPERSKSSLGTPKTSLKTTTKTQKPKYFCMDDNIPVTPKTTRPSNEKTPTYFCTPNQNRPPKSTSTTPFRTPVRRFFNEASAQSTPECFGTVQFETPRVRKEILNDEMTICEGETSHLTVGVRVRPMNLKELNDPAAAPVVKVDGSSVVVEADNTQHTFSYDFGFKSSKKNATGDQQRIFESLVLPLVDSAFEGYNACLFAYGQTGSGKSYSMMGSEVNLRNTTNLPEGAGIIPRFCHEMFSRAADNENLLTSVEISYFEIYNEKIHDLLASNNNNKKRMPLKVREHPVFGPYVVDLSQHCIQSYEDLQVWLKVGNSQKATAATEMNEKSSRSHSIFSIILTQTQKGHGKSNTAEGSRRSKINLVDLAGSERLSQTCASGERLREGVSINKSLLTLGKVIGSLAESTNNRKRGFVPYRESILTWLLKESLGGNSKTAMLATVAPSSLHLEETLATLRYACQARSIVNRVRINEDPHDKLIRQLKAEVQRLRGVRESYEKQISSRQIADGIQDDKEKEIESLRNQLRAKEEQLKSSQKTLAEKLQDAEEQKNVEMKFLRRCGVAVEIDFPENVKTPYLVHLAPDPILSGTLLYLIPEGSVTIGRNSEKNDDKSLESPDILLTGPLVASLHCTIENTKGQLALIPERNSDTYVNGQMITKRISLQHGDRLVIGGNHYFKVCKPGEIDGQCSQQQSVDYDFAHHELLTIQEEKLRKELEEAKQKALKELEIAKNELEQQFGSQKSNYEKEIKYLGSSLEKQKQALAEVTKRKRELEIEKEMLTNEIARNSDDKKIDDVTKVSPYRSNFLGELEKLLTVVTTDDVETTLAADAVKAGGLTLHEMQLLVREAMERCRDVGLNYEFVQQKVLTDTGLRSMIRVRDKKRKLEALWEPLYFLDWVNRLRDYEIENTIKDLTDATDNWEEFDENLLEDSLDTSRISINLTPIKKQLNESFQQSNGSIFTEEDKKEDKRREDMKSCLLQMEIAAKTLEKLCRPEITADVARNLSKINESIVSIKKSLNIGKIPKTPEKLVLQKKIVKNTRLMFESVSPERKNKQSPRKVAKSPIKMKIRNFTGKSVHFDD